MKDSLQALKDYQDALTRIADLERILENAPESVTVLREKWQSIEGGLTERREKQAAIEAEIQGKEQDLQIAVEQSKKFESDLHEVTNEREYAAALKEIDTVKRKMTALNEALKKKRAEVAELSGEIEQATKEGVEAKAEFDKALAEWEGEQIDSRNELDALREQLPSLTEKVPDKLLRNFKRIADRRGGIGLAVCSGGICTACFVRVRQNVVDQMRRHSQVFACESCKRILYYNEDE